MSSAMDANATKHEVETPKKAKVDAAPVGLTQTGGGSSLWLLLVALGDEIASSFA